MQISSSVFSSAVSSVQSGQLRVDQAAAELASQRTQGEAPQAIAPVELTESLLNMQQGLKQAEAGASMIKTADEVLGTLIDTHA